MSDRTDCLLEKYGIILNEEAYGKLDAYMDGILEANKSVNLTAITGKEEFIEKHYADSLSILKHKGFQEAERIIDIGTGGGFPGVPLAIAATEKKIVLLDSLAKRLNIIRELADEIGIDNIEVVHGRAEDYGKMEGYRESFDLCVSRAVAPLPLLVELCLPFVNMGGRLIAYKGREVQEELELAKNAIKIMGGTVVEKIDSHIGSMERTLIVIEKTSPTPEKYPRRAGIPEKRPLI